MPVKLGKPPNINRDKADPNRGGQPSDRGPDANKRWAGAHVVANLT